MARPKHPRPDANQRVIAQALGEAGYVVWDTSTIGGCVLDLMVFGWDAQQGRDRWLAVEVKSENGRLTGLQRRFLVEHPEAGIVARDVMDVLREFGRIQ